MLKEVAGTMYKKQRMNLVASVCPKSTLTN